MKNTTRKILALLIIVFTLTSLFACKKTDTDLLWESAIYSDSAVLGEGSISVDVEVKAGDRSVTFTVKTDKDTLGEALIDNGLIEGETGAYGLYVKRVNGILADYDVDSSYWSFYKNGEYLLTGVDTTYIADGEHYEIVYTK